MTLNDLCFEMNLASSAISGVPRYALEDYAFDFYIPSTDKEKLESGGVTSFVVGTLQLEVAIENSCCLYAWGYCPTAAWSCTTLKCPPAYRGSLHAKCKQPLIPGVSIGIENMIPVMPFFDPQSGWFCMGEKEPIDKAQVVEFASDSLAVICGEKLKSLWIKPKNWREVAGKIKQDRNWEN